MNRNKHTIEIIKTELEIEEFLDLHEKGWVVQRIGWFLIFSLVLFAALGFFGDGAVSSRTISRQYSTIGYERFYRHEATMELKIELQNTNGQMHISFPNHYLKHFKIESILPEPVKTDVSGDYVHYYFDGNKKMSIVFYLAPQKWGKIYGTVRINNDVFQLNHFIYP